MDGIEGGRSLSGWLYVCVLSIVFSHFLLVLLVTDAIVSVYMWYLCLYVYLCVLFYS